MLKAVYEGEERELEEEGKLLQTRFSTIISKKV
jgi:hypothetical protein